MVKKLVFFVKCTILHQGTMIFYFFIYSIAKNFSTKCLGTDFLNSLNLKIIFYNNVRKVRNISKKSNYLFLYLKNQI